MYHDMNPSPFGAILAQQNHPMPISHGWHGAPEPQSAISPVGPGPYSHAPHTPEADYQHPRPHPQAHFQQPSGQYAPTWTGPHTPIGSSPHTGVDDDEGDMFQPFGEEVAFPELNHASREGSGAPMPPPPHGKGMPYGVPLGDILNEHAMAPEDDLNAYSQGADNLGIGAYDENWKMLGQVGERFE
jgi:hypothetical protein